MCGESNEEGTKKRGEETILLQEDVFETYGGPANRACLVGNRIAPLSTPQLSQSRNCSFVPFDNHWITSDAEGSASIA